MAIENVLNNRRTWIKKSLETVFSIAICRQSGDKWQSKTLFLTTFVDSINVCRLPGVEILYINFRQTMVPFLIKLHVIPWFNKLRKCQINAIICLVVKNVSSESERIKWQNLASLLKLREVGVRIIHVNQP